MISAWVSRLEIDHLGSFRKRTFHFENGMNLVLGENGSGKTCLASVFPLVLFGVNQRRTGALVPPGKGKIALECSHSDGRVEIVRDLESNRVLVREFDENGSLSRRIEGSGLGPDSGKDGEAERSEYSSWLSAYFHLDPRLEDFLSRFNRFSGNSGFGFPAGTARNMAGGVLSDNVLLWLAETGKKGNGAASGEGRGGEGDLEKIQARLKTLESEWFEVKNRLDALGNPPATDFEHTPGEPTALQGRPFSRAKISAGEAEKILSLAGNDRDHSAGGDGLPESRPEVAELLEQRHNLLRQIARTGLPFDPPEKLTLLLSEAASIRQELVELQNQSRELQERLKPLKQNSFPMGLSLSAVFVLAGAAGCWFWPKLSLYVVLGVSALLGAIWTLVGRKQRARNRERHELQTRYDEIEKQRDSLLSKQEQLEPRFQLLGLSPSPVEMVRMQKNLVSHSELKKQLSETEERLKNSGWVPGDSSIERENKKAEGPGDVEERLSEAVKQPGNTGEHSCPPGQDPSGAEAAGLRRRLKEIEAEGEELHRRERSLAGENDKRAFPTDSAARFCLGVDPSEKTDRVGQLLGKIGLQIKETTSGGLLQARFNDASELEVLSAEGEWLKQNRMSDGIFSTIDLIVKLAGFQASLEGRFPWLVLDEPLKNLDARRKELMLRTMDNLSRRVQVIITTKDYDVRKKYRNSRWNFIGLEDSGRSEPEERSDDVGQLHLL